MILERCTRAMAQKIQARKFFCDSIKGDPIELLKAIREHCLNYQETKYDMGELTESMRTLCLAKQKEHICRVPWIQQMIPKIHEHFTLQCLCQPVGPHYGGRAIIHLNFAFFDFSVDAKEPVIHVLRPFAASPSVV